MNVIWFSVHKSNLFHLAIKKKLVAGRNRNGWSNQKRMVKTETDGQIRNECSNQKRLNGNLELNYMHNPVNFSTF